MVQNETLMQFQADILGVPVIRPKVPETTALGAAYAAGLAVGFWQGQDDIRANWAEDKRWEPTMARGPSGSAVRPVAAGRAAHPGLGGQRRVAGCMAGFLPCGSTSAVTTRASTSRRTWSGASGRRVTNVWTTAPPATTPRTTIPRSASRPRRRWPREPGSIGVVIGGSGNGEQIAANKVVGIRAALVWSEEIAGLAREHNDANVMSIGARMHDPDTALRLVEMFLLTPFTGAERHQRRIRQVGQYESR